MDVTGISVEKAEEIENASVVSGYVAPSTGHLVLATRGGTEIDAGQVVPDPPVPQDLSGLVKDVSWEPNCLIITRHDDSNENVGEPPRVRAGWAVAPTLTTVDPGTAYGDTFNGFTQVGGFGLGPNGVEIPYSGIYLISTHEFFLATTAGDFALRLSCHVNGTIRYGVNTGVSGSGAPVSFATAVPLNSGDAIKFSALAYGGSVEMMTSGVSIVRISA